MESGRQIIEDVRMWANESHLTTPSTAARASAAGLAEMHKDLPEIVGMSAGILKQTGIDAAMSRTTSRRLADAVVRETVHADSPDMTTPEKYEVVRRSLRNVLIQEAAGHEIVRRGGIDPSRALDRDPDTRGHGTEATKFLRRLDVDVTQLFGSMTEHDLARTSQGAYDKVSLIAHGPLAKALEAPETIMTKTQAAMNKSIGAPERENTMHKPRLAITPVRHLAESTRRAQPSFGRRIAQVHAMAGAGR